MSTSNNNNSGIIVAFHTGRGGRFHNAGFTTFIGEENMNDLIRINMNSNNLYYQDRVNGKFAKPFYTDQNGTLIIEAENVGKETGVLEFDGQYDTDSCCYIEDCSEGQLDLIAKSNDYKSSDLEAWMKENYATA